MKLTKKNENKIWTKDKELNHNTSMSNVELTYYGHVFWKVISWQIRGQKVIAMKFETAWIYFLSDMFPAFTLVVA